jgi:hypothetical protein
LFDEKEARVIVDRLMPGRLVRYQQGLPHGGGHGPDYGYREGERRYKLGRDGRKGRPLGCLTWAVDEPKARWIRLLFDTVDTTDVTDLSYRKLAARMERWARRPRRARAIGTRRRSPACCITASTVAQG